MVSLSTLQPVNSFFFWGVAGLLVFGGVQLGRKAYAMRAAPWLKKGWRWAASGLLLFIGAGSLLMSRTVPTDDVGISKGQVFEVGTYVWPAERFVSVNRNGSFLIPYPNERILLLVEYKVRDPERLKGLYEELLSHRAGLGKEHFLSSCGVDGTWRHSNDPFASWLQAKTRERMPSNPTAEGYMQYALEPVSQLLFEYGVSAKLSLVRKDLLRIV